MSNKCKENINKIAKIDKIENGYRHDERKNYPTLSKSLTKQKKCGIISTRIVDN